MKCLGFFLFLFLGPTWRLPMCTDSRRVSVSQCSSLRMRVCPNSQPGWSRKNWLSPLILWGYYFSQFFLIPFPCVPLSCEQAYVFRRKWNNARLPPGYFPPSNYWKERFSEKTSCKCFLQQFFLLNSKVFNFFFKKSPIFVEKKTF